MAEYVLHEDDDLQEVVRQLLDKAGDPSQVVWSPRPDVPHGGVYVVTDEVATEVVQARQAVRDAEAARIQAGLDAAEERDSHEGVAAGLVTPAEAGFPASVGVDPGAAGDSAETDEEKAEDAADDAVVDDPATPDVDEAAQARDRKANRVAARNAARSKTPAATEDASTEEGK